MSDVAPPDKAFPSPKGFKSQLRTDWSGWMEEDVQAIADQLEGELKPRTTIEIFYLGEFALYHCEAYLLRVWQNRLISAHTSKAEVETLRRYDIRSQEFKSWMDAMYAGQSPEDPRAARLLESTQRMREMIDGEAVHMSLPDLQILNQMRASAEARRDRALVNFYAARDRVSSVRPRASGDRSHPHARRGKSRKQGRAVAERPQARRKPG